MWAATFHTMLAALEQNATRAEAAFAMAHSAVAVVSPMAEGGIQHDGSFHQHGSQLYSGWGYGGIFSTNVLVRVGLGGTVFPVLFWPRRGTRSKG